MEATTEDILCYPALIALSLSCPADPEHNLAILSQRIIATRVDTPDHNQAFQLQLMHHGARPRPTIRQFAHFRQLI